MILFMEQNIFGKMIGIYQIRNTINNKVYIGQTKERFERRYWLHNFLLKNNKHDNVNLQNEYNDQNGEGFSFEVVEAITEPKEKLINIDLDYDEKYYIKMAREKGLCYNISDGGKGALGVPMTEANRKFHAEHNRILNTGKKASEETKRKMSEARKGIPLDKNLVKKMRESKEKKYLQNIKTNMNKITAQEAKEIKIALMNNISYDDLSAMYGVSKSNINAIRSNRSWRFVEVEGWEEYCENNKHNSRARQSRSAN